MEENCKNIKKPKTIKEFFRSSYFWKPFTAVAIGAGVGFIYYYFVGCSSGSCAITGNPYASMFWGGMMGLFVTNSPCKTC